MRDGEDASQRGLRFPLAEVSVAGWVVLLSVLTLLGSDLLWVVAMGDVIRESGLPDGVPFASAPQTDWHNPLVLAQVLLSLVHGVAPWGLAALHLLIVGLTMAVVVTESRRLGASELRTTLVIALSVVGCASFFVVARLPDLSLIPFVVAVAVMRRSHEVPGRAVWWLVPLYALWGNLHGGVLIGMAVLGVFLVGSPGAGSLLQRFGLGLAATLSLLLTSAGLDTAGYYVGVLTNEAVTRGTDLWASPDLGSPLDLALAISVGLLLLLSLGRGAPLWEWLVIAGLCVGTVMAVRNGVWLVLFLAPAAAGVRRSGRPVPGALRGRPSWWGPTVAVTAVIATAFSAWSLLGRGVEVEPAGTSVVDAVTAQAGGRPVLADEPLAETLAQAGITVWAVNPIDAFPRSVQADFLDFLHDGRVPMAAGVSVVVVDEALGQRVLARGGWERTAEAGGYVVLTPAQRTRSRGRLPGSPTTP